jgi:hypothetical protein
MASLYQHMCYAEKWELLKGAIGTTNPQVLEHANLSKSLQHAVNFATLGKISRPRHNPQVHRARRQKLRCCSSNGHDHTILACWCVVWSDVCSLRCSKKSESGSPNLPERRIAGTHITSGETRAAFLGCRSTYHDLVELIFVADATCIVVMVDS